MAKRILVPLDATARSESILSLIAHVARGAGATVRLLEIAPAPQTRIDNGGHVLGYAHHLEERREAEGLSRLRELEPMLDGVAVEHRVRFGDPVAEIVDEAERFDADLIALTSRRRRLWPWSLGRVVGSVRAKSPVPVLILAEGAAR